MQTQKRCRCLGCGSEQGPLGAAPLGLIALHPGDFGGAGRRCCAGGPVPGLAAAGPALLNSGRCCVYRVCVLREQNHRSCPLCPSQSPFVRTLTPWGCFQLCFWCLIFSLWAAEHFWGSRGALGGAAGAAGPTSSTGVPHTRWEPRSAASLRAHTTPQCPSRCAAGSSSRSAAASCHEKNHPVLTELPRATLPALLRQGGPLAQGCSAAAALPPCWRAARWGRAPAAAAAAIGSARAAGAAPPCRGCVRAVQGCARGACREASALCARPCTCWGGGSGDVARSKPRAQSSTLPAG